MAIRKIARLGHPILRSKASPLSSEEISSLSTKQLIRDMLDTVIDAEGQGLAAPQVYESKQIVLLDLDDGEGFRVWINPVLDSLTDECMITFEGCLSVPGMRGAVARATKLKVSALDEYGKPFELILNDYPAVIAQHECDHLNGILYVDRVELGTLCFLQEYRRFGHLFFKESDEISSQED